MSASYKKTRLGTIYKRDRRRNRTNKEELKGSFFVLYKIFKKMLKMVLTFHKYGSNM